MAIYVYIHEFCEQKAQKMNVFDNLEKLKENIESTQRDITSSYMKFGKCYWVSRKCGNSGGIIAKRTPIKENICVEFLGIMEWNSGEFKSFRNKPDDYNCPKKSEQELQDYINERNKTKPPEPKPSLKENESAWLYNAFSHQEQNSDNLVYETIEWKNAVSEDYIKQQLPRFYDSLSSSHSNNGFYSLRVENKPNWHIDVFKTEKNLFLLYPFTDKNIPQSISDKIEQYKSQLENNSEQNIIPSCRRAYPDLMLADEDIWIEIEKETVANMALSPEECNVLKDAREYNFPLFINGRAGSGKSTILQYIFADLLYHKVIEDKESDLMPIYLTANGELLKVAKDTTIRILKAECRKNEKDVKENYLEEMQNAFCEFRQYLISLLPKEEINNYRSENRIDFVKFKNLWKEWFLRDKDMKDCGAEISWHIIRTYIKGMSPDGLMITDDYIDFYKNLNKSERSVTDEIFKKVLDKIWTRYSDYIRENNLWDDQDLALYILEKDLAKPKHPAVLCDEAQDFTRIELEILFRLNLFSNRNIHPQDFKRVPFAFAGDQFQTLNPTGFRWDAIKASFTEKFIENFGSNLKFELNYKELTFNYRSTPPIVRFSNGVQCLRSVLFQIFDLLPQKPWSPQQKDFPVNCFKESDNSFWKKIKEIGTYIIIVPCNEGEELEFVNNNYALKNNVNIINEVPQNVLSAIRAKGREFPAVIVYGFGCTENGAPDLKLELKNNPNSTLIQTNELLKQTTRQLPHEYFINKLYVSVSRAKERLIIVDRENDISNFWSFMLESNEMKEIVNKANRNKKPEIWNSDENNLDIQSMTGGKIEDLTNAEVGDPKLLAEEFEKSAEVNRDSFSYRQAASWWLSAKEHDKAEFCLANAEELERKYLEAAEKYLNLKKMEKSIDCYWKMGEEGFEKLANLSTNEDISKTIEFRFACGYIQKNVNVVSLLSTLKKKMSYDEKFVSKICSETEILQSWEKMLNRLIDLSVKNINKESAKPMLDELDYILFVAHITIEKKLYGKILFTAEKFEESLKYLDKSSGEYKKAEIAVTPYPDKLEKISNADDRIDEFEKNEEKRLEPKYGAIIARDYLQKNQWEKSFEIAFEAGKEDILKAIMEQSRNENIKYALVKILARSEELIGLNVKERKKWSDFLNDKFLKEFLENRRIRQENFYIEELGSAIERAGNHINAVKFYKHLEENSFEETEKEFASKRYIVSLKRRIKNKQDERDTKEIDRIKEKYEYNDEIIASLPEYPELPQIEKPFIEWNKKEQKIEDYTNLEFPDTIDLKIGNIHLILYRKTKRINFEKSETGEIAYIKFTESLDIADTENWFEKEVKVDFSENKDFINLNFIKDGISVTLKI